MINSVRWFRNMAMLSLGLTLGVQSAALFATALKQDNFEKENSFSGTIVSLSYCYEGSKLPLATISNCSRKTPEKTVLLGQVLLKGGKIDPNFPSLVGDRSSVPYATSQTALDETTGFYTTKFFDQSKKLALQTMFDKKGNFVCSSIFSPAGKILTFLIHIEDSDLEGKKQAASNKEVIQFYENLPDGFFNKECDEKDLDKFGSNLIAFAKKAAKLKFGSQDEESEWRNK